MRLPAIFGCGLTFLAVARVDGEAMSYGDFGGQVEAASLIVEGAVVAQVEINQDRWMSGPFVYRRKSTFKVGRVYKGDVRVDDSLSVLSHSTFVCDTSHLEQGRPYILFLKRTKDGLVDIASGQGTYEIIEIGPKIQVAVNKFGDTTGGERVERLRSDIAWVLRGPTSLPAEPAISPEQAVKIAREAITQAGVNLAEYELTKTELIKAPYEFIGIAYRGDPVWSVQWTKPKAKEQSASPRAARTGGYVHAHTGKVRLSSRFQGPDVPSVEDVCRVFLATCLRQHPVSSQANKPIRIQELTETEFWNDVPRLNKMFLDVKPNYPYGTVFLLLDFDNVRPLIVVLEPPRRVAYAGELIALPAGSNPAK